MYQHSDPLYLICETPLHAGSGDDLGIVDLPIQRERHTHFPKVESSGLKGSLRTAFERKAKNDNELIKIHAAFGYDDGGLSDANKKQAVKTAFTHKDGNDTKEETQFAGCVGFSDARLLLFPVKAMRGIFVWVTCPLVINRYEQDLNLPKTNIQVEGGKAKVPKDFNLFIGQNKIILEEYSFTVAAEKDDKEPISQLVKKLATVVFDANDQYRQNKLKTSLVVLPDDAFMDFVTLSTEVITRTKIDNETGTVATGALFTEEFLPAESVLYSLVLSGPLFMKEKLLNSKKNEFADFLEQGKPNAAKSREVFKKFMDNSTLLFQLGGNASLGKGIVKAVFAPKTEGQKG